MGNVRKFWTRQVPQVWDEIEQTGRYVVKKEYIEIKNDTIAPYYLELYEWYTKESRKYIDIPEEFKYPIWLSVDEEYMLQLVENTIILELEVPEGEYLITNYEAWGYRVNYFYVPLNKEDERKHDAEIKANGIASEDALISTEKGNFYPLLKQKIIKSWDRVFTMIPEDNVNAVGTIWQIKKEWVKGVRRYEG